MCFLVSISIRLVLIQCSAYIAASRRSDRSLEARIESARRASEIHKKRTGRALRVTEQDVINEEMYEEEDDDLPTQYQRLNAHLHTTSVMFNKKLHDYIATQHGVRNMFMSQYQNASLQPQQYVNQYATNSASYPQGNNWLNPSMLPPQQFNSSTTSPGFGQQMQPQSSSPVVAQSQGFRQSPYHIPQRSPHQRSASIQLSQAPSPVYDASAPQAANDTITPGGDARRMSLPPHAFEHPQPTLSRTPTSHSIHQQPTSPNTVASNASPKSDQATPQFQSEASTPASLTFSPPTYAMHSQVLGPNPLSLSLPPESQQLIGSALDLNDPRTAMFMAGSDNLPQPFAPTYTYNPNNPSKPSKTADSCTPTSGIKSEHPAAMPSISMPPPFSDGFLNNDSFMTPGNCDYNSFFDFQTDFISNVEEQVASDQLDGSNFVNWD